MSSPEVVVAFWRSAGGQHDLQVSNLLRDGEQGHEHPDTNEIWGLVHTGPSTVVKSKQLILMWSLQCLKRSELVLCVADPEH